ncbi:MAG: hypothetical protein M1423_08265, partial [Acidobacteria bacterium]|nr:hypothetical protein [Acidobacteriota bacterium]
RNLVTEVSFLPILFFCFAPPASHENNPSTCILNGFEGLLEIFRVLRIVLSSGRWRRGAQPAQPLRLAY